MAICILVAIVIIKPPARHAAATETFSKRLGRIAADLCAKLGMQKEIRVLVASKNDRVVSVEKLSEPEVFVVTFDRRFLSGLDENEIRAALAHEIGHIWIFSHFPYLHTEALANDIALRAIPREDLERLYTRLQNHLKDRENGEEFLEANLPATQPQAGSHALFLADRERSR